MRLWLAFFRRSLFTQRMLIRSISNPTAQGKPLLLLPSCELVRWPKGTELPAVGTPYRGAALTFTGDALERLRRVLFSPVPLERCDAALSIQIHVVAQIYSPMMARHLHRVARHLCPEIRAHIQAGNAASLHRLVLVAYGSTPAEQVKRWNESMRALAAVTRAARSPALRDNTTRNDNGLGTGQRR
jgi:hypothetical protein